MGNFVWAIPQNTSHIFYESPSRYTDGTGGCDGCLDWTKMGVRYGKKNDPGGNGRYDRSFDDPGDISNGNGDNNNLMMTVLALEHVFKVSI